MSRVCEHYPACINPCHSIPSRRYAMAEDLENTITISLTPAQIDLINEQERKAIEAVVRHYEQLAPAITAGVAVEPHNPETCRDPACHCFPF
jgi:hypothetical protein